MVSEMESLLLWLGRETGGCGQFSEDKELSSRCRWPRDYVAFVASTMCTEPAHRCRNEAPNDG